MHSLCQKDVKALDIEILPIIIICYVMKEGVIEISGWCEIATLADANGCRIATH